MVMKCGILVVCLVCVVAAEIATNFKDLLVNKHNELRRKQQASNMNQLVWSDQLAQEADNWISRCNFEHEMKGRGENLAFNTGTDDLSNIDKAFEDWYNEINQYNYAGKACGMSCHYTQLVWSATREVGCAIKKCPSLKVFGQSVKDAWYIGCWYTPQGNDATEYPFLKGAACSLCLEGQTCDNGLCAGIGKEKCEDKMKDCVMWEASGSCTSNKKYMEKNCRQACGFCEGGTKECKDVSPDCARYGTKTCESNKAYMKPNCMKTCGFC